MFLLATGTDPQQRYRVGITVSRKVGGAVVRNRGRRLLREAFRRHKTDLLQPVDLVLVARASIVNMSFDEVERDFLKAVRLARLQPATA